MQFSCLKGFLGVPNFIENWRKIDENDLNSAKMHDKQKKKFLKNLKIDL